VPYAATAGDREHRRNDSSPAPVRPLTYAPSDKACPSLDGKIVAHIAPLVQESVQGRAERTNAGLVERLHFPS
jgi:hypothetical protein